MNAEMEAMRDKLREHINYDEGGRIRATLKAYAETNYIRQHTQAEYLSFMNQHECTFHVQGNQDSNDPYYWGLFTVISQHVEGDCVEECLDKAITAEAVGVNHVI